MESTEWAGNEGNFDETLGMQCVSGSEGLSDGAPGNLEAGLDLAPGALVHGRIAAPRKKVRIAFDIGHERVHVGGTVRHEGATVDDGHEGMRSRRAGTERERGRLYRLKPLWKNPAPLSRTRAARTMGKSKGSTPSNVIATNRKARHDYRIEDTLEAGLVLEGWEVKSLRQGRGQLRDSYVHLEKGEAWLHGSHISPLPSASTHVDPQPTRARKLLLHRKELSRLIGAIERRGFTAIALKLYWTRGRAKALIGTAQGKRKYDKRASERERDWQRQRERLIKNPG